MNLDLNARVAILAEEAPEAWSLRATTLVRRLDRLGWKEARPLRARVLGRMEKLLAEKNVEVAMLERTAR